MTTKERDKNSSWHTEKYIANHTNKSTDRKTKRKEKNVQYNMKNSLIYENNFYRKNVDNKRYFIKSKHIHSA